MALCENFLVYPQRINQMVIFFAVSWLEYFEYCVSYFLGHWQICFLALQGRFLNFSRFSPWFNGPWPLHCNRLCETFIGRKNLNGYFLFCFLTWIFWVLRFLFPWTFSNSFLRPKKNTIAFLEFSNIWVYTYM